MRLYTRLCPDERIRNYLPIFVNSYSSNYNQPDTEYPKGIFVHHLILVLTGQGIAEIDGEKVILEQDSLFFYRADIPIKYYRTSKDFTTCFLTFQGSSALQLLNFYNFPDFTIIKNKSINKQLFDICKAADNGTREEILSCRVYTLINDIGIFMNTNTLPRSFEKAVSFIRNNYYKDISVNDIAKYAGISESLLYKNFKTLLSTTPTAFITSLRVDWAKQFLENNPNLSIAEIGAMVGFTSTSYFIETFKKSQNITPLQYKKYINKIK